MTYFGGIHDLAFCFARGPQMGNAAYSQDWIGLGANFGAMLGKGMWYGKNKIKALDSALSATGTKHLKTPTQIVDTCMVAVAIIDWLNGFAAPNKGTSFSSGADKFENARAQLQLAAPRDDKWSGDAADAYAAQNAQLQELVRQMETLDKQMEEFAADQAAWVMRARNIIAMTGLSLVMAQGIALSLYLIPVYGPEVSLVFQVSVSVAAMIGVLTSEGLTMDNSYTLSKRADYLARQYDEVTQAATPSPDFLQVEVVAPTPETRVGAFGAAENGTSGMSTVFGMPTIASLAAIADQTTGGAETTANLGARTPAEAGTPAATDTTVTTAPPTRYVVRGTPIPGQTAKPAKRSVQPAATESAPVPAAAAGTPTGERAPVEVAAAHHPAQRETTNGKSDIEGDLR